MTRNSFRNAIQRLEKRFPPKHYEAPIIFEEGGVRTDSGKTLKSTRPIGDAFVIRFVAPTYTPEGEEQGIPQ